MRQEDDLYRSYTVAKANEYVIWADEPINQTIGFKRKLIACTYHTG